MPLFWLIRLVTSFISLAILAATGYLLWSWYQGDWYIRPDGLSVHVRETWRLWTGLAMLLWSLSGGFIVKWLLARPDREPLSPHRGDGEWIDGADGARIYVESVGRTDAPCLILTHGWGLDSTIWAYARRELADRFRLVLWDLPGMGLSRTRTRAVSLDNFAADLAQVIAWTGADRVILAGHSIGGMTIQTLARDHPSLVRDKVAGVILINTTWHNPLKTMILSRLCLALRYPLIEPSAHLTRWFSALASLNAWISYLNGSAHLANRLAFASQVTRSQLEHTTLLSTRNRQGVQAQGNLAMFRWSARGALAGLGVPVLVLAGKQDILTKPEASADIVADTPGARLHVFNDANHMGFLERSQAYNEAIADFAATAIRGKPARRPVAV
ncbi:MAG: alpha/beta hydrolase [Asticcacaulis sp.]|nr:alpha/beta hydrolase [Asticcacaulis sp.]